jgi:hypothetical protein
MDGRLLMDDPDVGSGARSWSREWHTVVAMEWRTVSIILLVLVGLALRSHWEVPRRALRRETNWHQLKPMTDEQERNRHSTVASQEEREKRGSVALHDTGSGEELIFKAAEAGLIRRRRVMQRGCCELPLLWAIHRAMVEADLLP